MKIDYYKSVLIITVIFYVIFTVLNFPYATMESYTDVEHYKENESYTDTEHYNEDVPYEDTEYYIEKEPYIDVEYYSGNEPINETLYTGILYVEYGDDILPKYYFYGETRVDHEKTGENSYNYTVCYYDKCDNYENIHSAHVETSTTTKEKYVQKTRGVTKYREVSKSRNVTKYRKVNKSRDVTKYREVSKSRNTTKYREIVLSLAQRMNIILDKV